MSLLLQNFKVLANKTPTSHSLQFVRHRLKHKIKEPFRKPVWQPTAPSKLYRIKKKTDLSPAEEAQRKHLESTYEINLKSINAYLRNEFYLPTLEAGGRSHEEVQSEEQDQEDLIKANAIENEKIAKMRIERENEFRNEKEAHLLGKQFVLDEENKRLGEQLNEIIKREIERSKTYITKDNLNEKIEKALIHPVCYDYAIDLNGKVIFDGSLHPYAFDPKGIPETSDVTEEFKNVDTSKPVYLNSKKLF